MMYYANSNNKQLLTSHLNGTMKLAMRAARHIGLSNDLVEIAGLSAFLHDVGKCTDYFQNVTLFRDDFNSEKSLFEKVGVTYPEFSGKVGKDFYPRHNEISWLYAITHAKSKSLFKKIAPQAIYWHHGTYLSSREILDPKTPRSSNSISYELSLYNKDELNLIFDRINNIIDQVDFPFDVSKYIEKDIDDSNEIIPRLFENEKNHGDPTNAQRLVIRSCVIYADHIVSSLSSDDLRDLCLENEDNYFKANNKSLDFDFVPPEEFDVERFNLQKTIVENCGKTTVVKAPAGFGKSLIGIIWGLKQSGPVYWVCPRNTVAEGVYENILEEVSRFDIPISVELFLTSEKKKGTHNNAPCTSDIIVTNIDNLLSPMVSYKDTNRLFDINANNVVFDEFHEFLNDEAIFGAFVTYMRARNNLCSNVKTLLLSATPSLLHSMWDSNSNKTTVLPNNEHHYQAQHNFKYNITFNNDFVNNVNDKSLTMYCSVKNVQDNYVNGYNHIIHSKYSDEDRSRIMKEILSIYGRSGNKIGKVISAPILQAALNISFEKLYKSIESPESDIQTFGRVNRWGELNKICDINLLNLFHDKRESKSIQSRYQWDLCKKWFEFIKIKFNKPLTLNEIYEVYNEFNTFYKNDLINYFSARHKTAIEKLCTFFPKQRKIIKNDHLKKISAKTLRNFTPNNFIVVKDLNGNWCNFTFSFQSYEVDDQKKDQTNISYYNSQKMKTIWENLNFIKNNDGEDIYDYSELLNIYFPNSKSKKQRSIYVDDIINYSRDSSTPLPIWTMVYDSKLGLRER